MSEETRLGKIEIAPTAIASLASQAVLASYGVVGMTARGLAQVLRRDAHRGVEVRLENDQIIIDLYVVLEYGTNILTVARNIMSNVKFGVEKALGVPISQVNVHVQALRVSGRE